MDKRLRNLFNGVPENVYGRAVRLKQYRDDVNKFLDKADPKIILDNDNNLISGIKSFFGGDDVERWVRHSNGLLYGSDTVNGITVLPNNESISLVYSKMEEGVPIVGSDELPLDQDVRLSFQVSGLYVRIPETAKLPESKAHLAGAELFYRTFPRESSEPKAGELAPGYMDGFKLSHKGKLE